MVLHCMYHYYSTIANVVFCFFSGSIMVFRAVRRHFVQFLPLFLLVFLQKE